MTLDRAARLPPLLLTALLVAGCTGSEATRPRADTTSTAPGSAAPGTAATALVLRPGDEGLSCFRRAITDLAWFNVTWKAKADLDEVTFRLTETTGVRVIGAPRSVPPRNFGGRIAYGGTSTWPPSAKSGVLDTQVVWSAREDADFLSAGKGQTGLLAFHLRFDDATLAGEQRAELGKVEAEYVTASGETGTAAVDVRQRYSFSRKDCR